MARLYPVPAPSAGRLAIAPRPPGGAALGAALAGWAAEGVGEVVSLLTPEESGRLGLAEEAAACAAAGLAFRAFPVPDFGVPADPVGFARLAGSIGARLAAGSGVAIHCRGGIGRSGTLAAAVLMAFGTSASDAVAAVSAARGVPSPETDAQRAWLSRLHLPEVPTES
jgi:protein-tyrosine phosphatase